MKSTLNPEITPTDDPQNAQDSSHEHACGGRTDLTPPPRGNPCTEGDRSGNGPQSALFDPLAYCPPGKRSRYEATARGAIEGSYPKAVKLKCLDCCGWEYPEAKRCQIHQCALWLLNRRIFARNGRSES